MADTFCQTTFPPLGIAQLSSFLTGPFQVFFAKIIGERLDIFFPPHF
jgi:hypothetical protein